MKEQNDILEQISNKIRFITIADCKDGELVEVTIPKHKRTFGALEVTDTEKCLEYLVSAFMRKITPEPTATEKFIPASATILIVPSGEFDAFTNIGESVLKDIHKCRYKLDSDDMFILRGNTDKVIASNMVNVCLQIVANVENSDTITYSIRFSTKELKIKASEILWK